MTTIQEIMQVGVGMPDLAKFESFTQDMLGLPASRSPEGNIMYVRPDQYHHRIAAAPLPSRFWITSGSTWAATKNSPNGKPSLPA